MVKRAPIGARLIHSVGRRRCAGGGARKIEFRKNVSANFLGNLTKLAVARRARCAAGGAAPVTCGGREVYAPAIGGRLSPSRRRRSRRLRTAALQPTTLFDNLMTVFRTGIPFAREGVILLPRCVLVRPFASFDVLLRPFDPRF